MNKLKQIIGARMFATRAGSTVEVSLLLAYSYGAKWAIVFFSMAYMATFAIVVAAMWMIRCGVKDFPKMVSPLSKLDKFEVIVIDALVLGLVLLLHLWALAVLVGITVVFARVGVWKLEKAQS